MSYYMEIGNYEYNNKDYKCGIKLLKSRRQIYVEVYYGYPNNIKNIILTNNEFVEIFTRSMNTDIKNKKDNIHKYNLCYYFKYKNNRVIHFDLSDDIFSLRLGFEKKSKFQVTNEIKGSKYLLSLIMDLIETNNIFEHIICENLSFEQNQK
jgi:hypothetical protein